MSISRWMRSLVSAVVCGVLWGAPGHACHGELPNRPLLPAGATVHLDRYTVIIPPGIEGPVAVTAAVYYQSFEAVVAKKLLGNLADTDLDGTLEPCVLKGACDGRQHTVKLAVVEGAPPVPMQVTNWVMPLTRTADTTPPTATTYPRAGADNVYEDVVVKVVFSEPVTGVDATTVTLTDAQGTAVPASVAQVGDYTWGLFPHQVFLTRGETYTARVAASVCDVAKNCLAQALTWRFTITGTPGGGQGDTSIPLGGSSPLAGDTKAIMRSPAPVGPPVDGQPQPPKPDAALPTSTHTARP